MTPAYPHLLSPIKVRNFVLKNRMLSANSQPHFHQGPEKYPAEATFAHFVERARHGASIVTFSAVNDTFGMPELPTFFDVAHFPHYDIYDPQCQNYIAQLFDAIHYYNSLVSVGLFSSASMFPYFHEDGSMELVDAGNVKDKTKLVTEEGRITDALSVETLEKVAASFAQQSAYLKRLGVDMVTLHMCYRGQFLGQFISPLTNFRTDEFGGNLENRARFPLMVFKAIREAVGEDFLIEIEVSGDEEGGNSTEDMIWFLKQAEKYVDIAQIRGGDPSISLPSHFYPEKNPTLPLAEAIKKSGVNMLICAISGFLDPDDAEAAIRDGKADLIGFARAFIANPDFGELVYSGRKDDIVPCLRCNKCHGRGPSEVLLSTCSVNPVFGIEHHKKLLDCPTESGKSVAVVGGGPGGMRAALFLTERGHKVTIYEKESALGGLIRHADNVDFKWTLRDYKDYLIRQVEKQGIEVILNTTATPEMLEGKYDAVIAALGSVAKSSPIPGADGSNVFSAVDTMTDVSRLGKQIVVIGGGEVGTETGLFLARSGRKVTVLARRDRLAPDAPFIHYMEQLQAAWEAEPNFSFILNASATAIREDGVSYRLSDGTEGSVPADSVVIAVGQVSRQEEALAFYGCAPRFYMVGDCIKPGTIQSVNRSAYAAASQI